ncbi:hypothetical protein [Lysinibacillus endophyticus]|nr:hypothetical protein [Lysinibacillus endophyticus]
MQLLAYGANAESLFKTMGLEMPNNVIDLSENVNTYGAPEEN